MCYTNDNDDINYFVEAGDDVVVLVVVADVFAVFVVDVFEVDVIFIVVAFFLLPFKFLLRLTIMSPL